jgi:hypothetical protein
MVDIWPYMVYIYLVIVDTIQRMDRTAGQYRAAPPQVHNVYF